jgi:hypothetical protein
MSTILNHLKNRFLADQYQSPNGYLVTDEWVDVALASATALSTATATSASATTTVTTFTAQPDFPRNIVITPGGTTASVPAGDVVVTGTNIRGEVITENFTFAADASTATTGTKAFKTVTSIVYPIQDGAGATYNVGTGAKLGLSRKMKADNVMSGSANGTYEATRPVGVYSTSAIESNIITFTTAFDGSKDMRANYVSHELYAGRG